MFRHALKQQVLPPARSWRVVDLSKWSSLRIPSPRRQIPSLSPCLYPAPPRSAPVRNARRRFSSSTRGSDTIYALSSGHGRAGIAVIRISGSACLEAYKGLCPSMPFPKPRHAVVRTLYDPSTPSGAAQANILDTSALVLFFPGPRSATGEDVLELHVHGGLATVRAVLAAIPLTTSPATRAIRYAEPGEFTRRAFLSGRLDLAQAEALGAALAAETEQQRRAAVRGASGALGRAYDAWRERLLAARAELEALIDFAEDQHFDEPAAQLLRNVSRLVAELVGALRAHEEAGARGELLRVGIRVALLGPPNAGKSSLMNRIVGREASIVSGEAGTTRDVVEARLDLKGYLCSFADTAGFRSRREGERIGAVEEEGIRRARQKAVDADVVVALASIETGSDGQRRIVYDSETLRLAAGAQQRLVVVNKRDAVTSNDELAALIADFRSSALARIHGLEDVKPIVISCVEAMSTESASTDPGGVHALVLRLANSFAAMTELPPDMQDLLGVTERQRQLLAECREHLEDYVRETTSPAPLEEVAEKGFETEVEPDIVLAAEHLRFAADCLARITGRGEGGDVEEVLGVIFEKFCVGK